MGQRMVARKLIGPILGGRHAHRTNEGRIRGLGWSVTGNQADKRTSKGTDGWAEGQADIHGPQTSMKYKYLDVQRDRQIRKAADVHIDR